MTVLTKAKQWSREHPDVMIDLVRIYLGIGLMVKGVYLMAHQSSYKRCCKPVTTPYFLGQRSIIM